MFGGAGKYMAAAKAGANTASSTPAAEGVVKAHAKLGEKATSTVHRGSSAGLRNEASAVLEIRGQGYGKSSKIAAHTHTQMDLKRPASSVVSGARIADLRTYKNSKLSMDEDLRRLS
jgi:hypothetical protein